MITPDRLQGRVNGTMRFIAQCTNPVGAFLAGIIGTIAGLQIPLFIGALGIQLGFVILFLSPVRNYENKPVGTP
ncbi:MAG TPA: hypothetical protein VL485_01270 [Ktedonobacteraceae bacterium]|nr:hypothetical protein [Ktedonobacteraceae bacterium]